MFAISGEPLGPVSAGLLSRKWLVICSQECVLTATMRMSKLCGGFVGSTAPAPMGQSIEGRRDLRIVKWFAGTV